MSENQDGGMYRRGFYLSRLWRVLGWKGATVLASLLAATVVLSVVPTFGGWGAAAIGVAVLVLVGMAMTGSLPGIQREGDIVGTTVGLVAAVAGVIRVTSLPEPWWAYGLFAGVVLASVALDYWRSDERSADHGWRKVDLDRPEIMKVDLPGLVVAETLVIFAILLGAGWTSFATSPYFGGLAFYFGASIFAIAAGYSEIARETAREDRDYDLHEFLLETLIDLQGVEDETLRRDLARNLRTVADHVEGASIPSIVNDRDGPVPVVLPTRDPVKLYQGGSLDGLREALDTEDLTGYVVTDDGDVFLARNGSIAKCYADGHWTVDPGELDEPPRRALFYTTSHGLLNLVDGVTPPDYADDEAGVAADADVSFRALLDEVTGREVDPDKPFSVGGRDVNLREMFDRADDLINRLTEK